MDPYGSQQHGQLAQFDERRARARTDPFAMMDQMMGGMMMGSMLGGGGRSRGGGFGMMGGSLFDEMDAMTANSGSVQGGGGFSCQTFGFSSRMGADGQVHTEQFSSSTVGDRSQGFRETQQAYANNTTGMDKMSMERQINDQGRKMVRERNRQSGEERQTEMFRGLEEDQAAEFDSRWQQEASPHLPRHNVGQLSLAGGYPGRVAQSGAARLPSGHRGSAPAIQYSAPPGQPSAQAGYGVQAPRNVVYTSAPHAQASGSAGRAGPPARGYRRQDGSFR